MIRFRVREIAEQKGMTAQALSDKSTLAYSTIMDLWHDRAKRIDKRTLGRLCQALEADPGDIIVVDDTINIQSPVLAAA